MGLQFKQPNGDYTLKKEVENKDGLYVGTSPEMKGGAHLDKLALKYTVIDPLERDKAYKIVKVLRKKFNNGHNPTYAKSHGYESGYLCSCLIPPDPKNYENKILIQCDPNGGIEDYLRIEFNPSRHSSFQHIQTLLNSILGSGYERIMQGGRVARVDIETMIYFCKIGELLFLPPQMSVSEEYLNGGEIETLYLGKEGGEHRWCIYDKWKEGNDKSQKLKKQAYFKKVMPQGILIPSKESAPVRIEHRYNPPKKNETTLPGILNLPNPFESLHIGQYCDLENIPALKTPEERSHFYMLLEACQGLRKRPIQDLLRKIEPTARRKKFRKILKSHPATFWKPQTLTPHINQAINNLLRVPGINKGPSLPEQLQFMKG